MLATKFRFTQSQDPTGVARATCGVTAGVADPVTVPAYQVHTTIAPIATRLAPAAGNGLTAGSTWTVIERKAMSKVDFHDRWPLYSTS